MTVGNVVSAKHKNRKYQGGKNLIILITYKKTTVINSDFYKKKSIPRNCFHYLGYDLKNMRGKNEQNYNLQYKPAFRVF